MDDLVYPFLSAEMKEALALLEVIKAVASGFGINQDTLTEFRVTIWEDNMGALTFAQHEPGQHTIGSKFYHVRAHWFREKLQEPGSKMSVRKVASEKQLSGTLTKPLTKIPFERLRKELNGW